MYFFKWNQYQPTESLKEDSNLSYTYQITAYYQVKHLNFEILTNNSYQNESHSKTFQEIITLFTTFDGLKHNQKNIYRKYIILEWKLKTLLKFVTLEILVSTIRTVITRLNYISLKRTELKLNENINNHKSIYFEMFLQQFI